MNVQQTPNFQNWLDRLKDRKAQQIIAKRIIRIQSGLMGDTKSLGDGISEARIDYGPGYRIYYTERGGNIVILLAGGDKKSQDKDIKEAKKLAGQIP